MGTQKVLISTPLIKWVPIEIYAPIENQGNFDGILQKVMNLMISQKE